MRLGEIRVVLGTRLASLLAPRSLLEPISLFSSGRIVAPILTPFAPRTLTFRSSLSQLQTTEAETNFDLLREQTADRISSMQKTIEFLEDKIGMRADEIASKEELLMVEKKLRAKEKVRPYDMKRPVLGEPPLTPPPPPHPTPPQTLGFYEKLTSTTVAYNKKSNKFECVCVNPENNKGVKFEVKR